MRSDLVVPLLLDLGILLNLLLYRHIMTLNVSLSLRIGTGGLRRILCAIHGENMSAVKKV